MAAAKVSSRRRRFQARLEVEWRLHGRFWEGFGAALAVVVFIWMGTANVGPFSGAVPPTPATNPSLWQYLLADHWTLGAIHVAIIGLSLYAGASVVALAFSGRWLRAIGRSGASVDDRRVEATTAHLEATVQRQDAALGSAEALIQGLRGTLGDPQDVGKSPNSG
jgi:hypothetical protein